MTNLPSAFSEFEALSQYAAIPIFVSMAEATTCPGMLPKVMFECLIQMWIHTSAFRLTLEFLGSTGKMISVVSIAFGLVDASLECTFNREGLNWDLILIFGLPFI